MSNRTGPTPRVEAESRRLIGWLKPRHANLAAIGHHFHWSPTVTRHRLEAARRYVGPQIHTVIPRPTREGDFGYVAVDQSNAIERGTEAVRGYAETMKDLATRFGSLLRDGREGLLIYPVSSEAYDLAQVAVFVGDSLSRMMTEQVQMVKDRHAVTVK